MCENKLTWNSRGNGCEQENENQFLRQHFSFVLLLVRTQLRQLLNLMYFSSFRNSGSPDAGKLWICDRMKLLCPTRGPLYSITTEQQILLASLGCPNAIKATPCDPPHQQITNRREKQQHKHGGIEPYDRWWGNVMLFRLYFQLGRVSSRKFFVFLWLT